MAQEQDFLGVGGCIHAGVGMDFYDIKRGIIRFKLVKNVDVIVNTTRLTTMPLKPFTSFLDHSLCNLS